MDFRLAIVIPARNEANSIQAVIDGIRALNIDCHIVVVNDASTDPTPTIAKKSGVTCLNHIESLGAWQATQTGLIYAQMQGYTHVITMDADGQHLSTEIEKLIEAIEVKGAVDVVIGACQTRASFAKKLVWNIFRKISGIKIGDITSGFRIYNQNALSLLVSQRASLLEYQDVGVLLLLKSSGLKVCEVQVKMDKRFDGNSRIFSSWFKIFYYLLSTLLISFSKVLQKTKQDHKSGQTS